MQDFLSGLNPAQLQAVQTIDGPLLLLAGAGTGKTRTVLCRLAYLAAQPGIDPAKLLALTFTTRAAEEMRERFSGLALPGRNFSAVRICTIHALCLDILKRYGASIGIGPEISLLMPADRTGLIRQACRALQPGSCGPVKKLELQITREKNGPAGYSELSPLGRAYQQLLESRGLLDFDDLILKTGELFAADPGALAAIGRSFSHISVDEYQDVNPAQYAFLRALCPENPNLCAVGDADQAIYGFRGAQVDIFLRFQQDFPGAALLRLEDNYRSSATIVHAAQKVIKNNTRRIEKLLQPLRPAAAPLEIRDFQTDQDEAAFMSREIERLMGGMRFESLRDGDEHVQGFGDIAVLYRLHQQGKLIKKALQSRGIPVDMAATRSQFDEPGVRSTISMLELLAAPGRGAAVAALLTDAPFAVGEGAREKICAALQQATVAAVLKQPPLPIPRQARTMLQALDQAADRLAGRACALSLDAFIAQIWQELYGAATEKPDEYFALLTASMAYSGMPALEAAPLFIEKLALLQEAELCCQEREAVRLMTVHSAKGLEFSAVFLAGLEQGLFPFEKDGDEADALEEERRLFYVGMTRAKDRLYLLHSRSRFLFGERRPMSPSCFLKELPAGLCSSSSERVRTKPRQKQLKLFAG